VTDSILVLGTELGNADTITQLYQSPSGGQGTVITACTVANNTNSSVSFKLYIYSQTGEVISAIVPMSIVVPDRYNSCASAVNHVVPAGGTIRAECSEANSLAFTITGSEQ